MSSNRRQHWVPQSYLRGFADDDRLRVYARIVGPGARTFETSTINIANRRDLYTITTQDGADNSLDDAFRREVEDAIPKTLAPLSSGRALTRDERAAILELAGYQDMRGPNVVDSTTNVISDVHRIARALYRQHRPELSEGQIDELLREKWDDTGLTGEHALDSKNLAVRVLSGTRGFTGQFGGMYGCIVESAAQKFVTSDRPVVFHDPQNLKPGFWGIDRSAPTTEVVFTLTRQYALVMARIPLVPYAYANAVGATLINGRIAFGASKQVFAFPETEATLSQRQRKDILSSFGALGIALLLIPDESGKRVSPLLAPALKAAPFRLRPLAGAFTDRVLPERASA